MIELKFHKNWFLSVPPIYLTLMRRRALLFVLRRHAHRCKNTLTQIRARRYKYKYKYTTSARPTCVSICVLSSPTQMLNCSNGSAAFVYGCVLPPEWRLVATATATASAPPPSAHPAIQPSTLWSGHAPRHPILPRLIGSLSSCLLSRWLPFIFVDSVAPT